MKRYLKNQDNLKKVKKHLDILKIVCNFVVPFGNEIKKVH